MHTKSVQYSSDATTIPTVSASGLRGMIDAARQKFTAVCRRIENQRATARNNAARTRQAQRQQQDAIRGLPLAEKQRLGLHHLVD